MLYLIVLLYLDVDQFLRELVIRIEEEPLDEIFKERHKQLQVCFDYYGISKYGQVAVTTMMKQAVAFNLYLNKCTVFGKSAVKRDPDLKPVDPRIHKILMYRNQEYSKAVSDCLILDFSSISFLLFNMWRSRFFFCVSHVGFFL